MKKAVLAVFVSAIFSIAFAEKSEPRPSAFESKIFAEAESAKGLAEKLSILLGASNSKDAGPALFFNAANVLAQNSQFKEAEKFYKKALEKMPDFYLARRNLSYLYYNNGDYAAASENFAKTLSLSDDDAAKIFKPYALSLIGRSMYDEALALVEQALIYAPDDETLLRAKAKCLYETGQGARLLKFAEAMLARFPEEPLYWRMLARMCLESQDFYGAAASLCAMQKLGAASDEDMLLLGDVYVSLGMYDAAAEAYGGRIKDLKKAYSVARFFALAGAGGHASKFLALLDAGSPQYLEIAAIIENTKPAYEKAYAANPSNSFLALKLAEFNLAQNLTESARALYAQSMRDYERESLWGLARADVADGKFKDAAAILEKISKKFGTDLDGHIEKLKAQK